MFKLRNRSPFTREKFHECMSLLFPVVVDAREEVAAQQVARNIEKKGERVDWV